MPGSSVTRMPRNPGRLLLALGTGALVTLALGVGPLVGGPAAAAVSPKQAAVSQGADPTRTDAAGTEWLCNPAYAVDPCRSNENALVQRASGRNSVQLSSPARNPKIDCFYVYPTVSRETTLAANLQIQAAETFVAQLQASRFSSVCRVYAPMYPQITSGGLEHPGGSFSTAVTKGYDVIQSAWKDYMAHDNHGRGVVVIGHSQGSTMAQELIRTQIDPNAHARSLLVSAILPGGNVVVPIGRSVGGTFQHLASCSTATQLHCIIAYSSFDQTPPKNALFGTPGGGVSFLDVTPGPTKGMQVLCVNPAELSAGVPGVLQPYFPRNGRVGAHVLAWATQPNLYSGRCMYQNGSSWLQVNAPIVAGDPRTPVSETLGPIWGLHLDDVNLFLGNLVGIVGSQSKVYLRTHA
jgi:Protein of unknown function (DUF3089)